MTGCRLLHALALLLMQGGFPGAAEETVTLKEGQDLNLHCALRCDNTSALQWSNPRGFTIFLNTQQVLRGQRYKLLHYSKDELSIRVSNVTVHDEGSYQCLCYSSVIKSMAQTVEVLAAPSNPVLEVFQDTKRGVTLSCFTQGCKPQPQISWLLDNGIELPGDTKHKLGADGKKWSTTSTLTVLSYRANATATCIIHHPALAEEKLVASFHLENVSRTGCKHQTSPSPAPEGPAGSSSSPAPEGPAGSSPSAAPEGPAGSSSSAAPEGPAGSSSAPPPTQQNLTSDPTSTWPEETSASSGDEELGSSWSDGDPKGSQTAFKGITTEEEPPRREAPLPCENATGISIFTLDQDPKSKGILKKEKNLLLPILVAALLFVLLIIVLLFVMKLKKAHGVWKRENDVSEQTLESYKSRSNEDSPGHEKNGHVANQKSNIQYVSEGQGETTRENPSVQNIAISEKMFECGRETDV